MISVEKIKEILWKSKKKEKIGVQIWGSQKKSWDIHEEIRRNQRKLENVSGNFERIRGCFVEIKDKSEEINERRGNRCRKLETLEEILGNLGGN